ncbi:DUF2306 domain-containing protein [Epibacterium sp. Ofav1-8]|uniref:DUF2306 domain-containing protein n=1 Tax=Epibacterium sp. Ofav1-8 TaxID=2917735 RepID=UPI001EF683AF|nr:DUF2306 domain-containing protein [Epibacterium sp. Ofav1-8]MCG7625582.1 DUF2306 domain-containing protein [Epibacterium sp. Ofav1-8]
MASFPLLPDAAPVLSIHICAALTAVCVTPAVLWRRRRDALHKGLGYIWVSAMAVTALSAFGLSGSGLMGPVSPLHALSFLTLWGLWVAIRAIRRGDRHRHQATLRGLATYALGVPMVLIFLPGRRFSNTFFPDTPWAGLMLAALAFAGIVAWRRWWAHPRALSPER